jgi:hypothetical protein
MVPMLTFVIVISGIACHMLVGLVEKSVLELKRSTNNAMSPLMVSSFLGKKATRAFPDLYLTLHALQSTPLDQHQRDW